MIVNRLSFFILILRIIKYDNILFKIENNGGIINGINSNDETIFGS